MIEIRNRTMQGRMPGADDVAVTGDGDRDSQLHAIDRLIRLAERGGHRRR